MELRETLPATSFWLRKLSSRTACRVYVGALALVFLPALALRIQAAYFQRRAVAVVSALSKLQVGVSSKADAIAQLHALNPATEPHNAPRCNADECISVLIPNSRLSDAVFLRALRSAPVLYPILTLWGFRYWTLSAYVKVNSGKVSFVSYYLMLSDSHFDGGADSIVLEVIESTASPVRPARTIAENAHDETYRITTSSLWPGKGVRVVMTPSAPQDLVNRAFGLRLRCLWSSRGCETWSELLPLVHHWERQRPGATRDAPSSFSSNRSSNLKSIP